MQQIQLVIVGCLVGNISLFSFPSVSKKTFHLKNTVFDLTKVPFLICLIVISCLMVAVLNDWNLFKKSNLVNSFSSYVQFCSGGHFSERAEAAR